MNRFKSVCDRCPVRTKVDVDRAHETMSFGTDGAVSHLSDGVRHYDVSLSDGGVYNSDAAAVAEGGVAKRIEACERPQVGLLRSKCGAGLASASRWAECLGHYEPNVSGAEDIMPLLDKADYRDAMPNDIDGDTWLVGDVRDFSELTLSFDSPFSNYGIRKMKKTVRGSRAELRGGQAVMLDRLTALTLDEQDCDIYRIRIAQGGPHFIYEREAGNDGSVIEAREVRSRIFADAIFAYLNSDGDAIEKSNELARAIEIRSREQDDEIGEYITGRLAEELAKINDTNSQ